MRQVSALIWLSYVSLFILSLVDNIRGPFFPDILAELHLDGTRGSAFFATTSLFAFIGSWASHRLLYARSSLFLLSLGALGVGIGFAAVSVSYNFILLMVACAFLGWFFGALNLAQNAMVFETNSPHLRRRLLSGLHSMYALASLTAPFIATAYRWLGFSWRQCFLSLALLPLAIALSSLKFKGKPSHVSSRPLDMNGSEWRRCVIFSLMMAAYLWGEVSASSRMVLWLRTAHGFSPDLANLYLSGFFLTLLVGRTFFSFVHFQGVGNWLILCASAGLSASFYALALYASPVWLVLSGLSLAPFFPVAMEQVSIIFGAKSNQALGFVLGFGSLSLVAMHMVIGILTDLFGISQALLVGPLTLLLVFAVLAVILIFPQVRTAESKSR